MIHEEKNWILKLAFGKLKKVLRNNKWNFRHWSVYSLQCKFVINITLHSFNCSMITFLFCRNILLYIILKISSTKFANSKKKKKCSRKIFPREIQKRLPLTSVKPQIPQTISEPQFGPLVKAQREFKPCKV